MKKILTYLFEHKTLSRDKAKEVLVNISKGIYSDAEIASFTTVFLMRSITIPELLGFRDALIELCVPVDLQPYNVIDIVGTGGDGKNTFNISTLSCFIVSGTGQKVAKHGNYGAVYVATKQFLSAEEREQDAWAQLRGMETWSGPLGSAGRVHFTSALQAARLELWETSIGAKIAFQRARALGLGDFTPKAMLEGYALPHAVCLPIDTPRDRALQILNGNSGIGGQPK